MPKTGLSEQREIRLNKINTLLELGINPYLSKSIRTHYTKDITENYESYEGVTVTVAGRLMSIRKHGSLTFAHIQDQMGRIQLSIAKNILKPFDSVTGNLGYGDLKLLDIGDHIEATGMVSKTKRGEISVLSDSLKLLTKSIRPLPDKWSGLKDREKILRKRYLDTIVQSSNKSTFLYISHILYAVRTFLHKRGFVEFLTPVLQPQYGGGTAKPFITHLNALNFDIYLAISHELYLKRLIAAGYDKVYTIGRYFRNEGIDKSHHPEFSMIETMTAYEDYEYNMDLIEELFRYIAKEVFNKTEFNVSGHNIDFGKPWKRISMSDAVIEVTGIDFDKCNSIDEANSHLLSLGIDEPQTSIGLALSKVFEHKVEPTLISPTLVFGHPIDISPLAKPMDLDPQKAQRFEIFIAGMECGDNWSEQNNPIELLERWKSNYYNKREDEFHPLDYDFIEVLEYGIPPTTGIGPGIERMAMIFTGQENIDDVIFFPIMKPVISKENVEIYNTTEIPNPSDNTPNDINLTIEELEDFISEHSLQDNKYNITVRPYLRFWNKLREEKNFFRASGYIEINGFLEKQTIRVVGYIVKSESNLNLKIEINRFLQLIESSIFDLFSMYTVSYDIQVFDVVIIKK